MGRSMYRIYSYLVTSSLGYDKDPTPEIFSLVLLFCFAIAAIRDLRRKLLSLP